MARRDERLVPIPTAVRGGVMLDRRWRCAPRIRSGEDPNSNGSGRCSTISTAGRRRAWWSRASRGSGRRGCCRSCGGARKGAGIWFSRDRPRSSSATCRSGYGSTRSMPTSRRWSSSRARTSTASGWQISPACCPRCDVTVPRARQCWGTSVTGLIARSARCWMRSRRARRSWSYSTTCTGATPRRSRCWPRCCAGALARASYWRSATAPARRPRSSARRSRRPRSRSSSSGR